MIAQRDILSEIMDEITIRRKIYGIRERILSKPDEAHRQSLLHGHMVIALGYSSLRNEPNTSAVIAHFQKQSIC